jgi:carboxypeptidase Taq
MQTLQKTHPKLQELKTLLTEVDDIYSAASLLYWDQATYMPPGGAAARGVKWLLCNRLPTLSLAMQL